MSQQIQITYPTIMAYRDTFLRSHETRQVLKVLLNDLYYFGELENDEQRILHNAAKRIKAKLGVGLIEMWDAEIESFRTIMPAPMEEPPKETIDNE